MFDLLNNIETYFKDQHLDRLVRHQLESYNNFVGYQIIKTIEMFNPVHIKSEEDYDDKSGKYTLEIFITCTSFNFLDFYFTFMLSVTRAAKFYR